jgi:hypothetical protein
VADGPGGGLRIIDVSNPSSPTEVGFLDTPGWAYSVAVSGSVAYVADGDGGLRVIDVSDPSNPVELGFYDTPGSPGDIVIEAGYAYVADGGSGGLRVFDISSPGSPFEVGYYDVASDGPVAYVGDEEGGLVILRYAEAQHKVYLPLVMRNY